jgi:hypothetical protein
MVDINNTIKEYHNPSLVDVNISPNGNIIYHIYSDGTITSQKGGWAYLRRSEFTSYFKLSNIPYGENKFKFPINANDGTTYAIVTEENALKIRKIMQNYNKQQDNL